MCATKQEASCKTGIGIDEIKGGVPLVHIG